MSSLENRFWSKVDRRGDDECWPWTAGQNGDGYGLFYVDRSRPKELAHRFAYELLVGPIPEGLDIDHVSESGCAMRHCMNALAHMEPVTRRENVLRGTGLPAANALKTHCAEGHEFTPENTYVYPDGRHRECRTCKRNRDRARRKAA